MRARRSVSEGAEFFMAVEFKFCERKEFQYAGVVTRKMIFDGLEKSEVYSVKADTKHIIVDW